MAAHVDHLARSRIAALVARRSDGLVDRADAAEPNRIRPLPTRCAVPRNQNHVCAVLVQ
jgi:hypothetical protein